MTVSVSLFAAHLVDLLALLLWLLLAGKHSVELLSGKKIVRPGFILRQYHVDFSARLMKWTVHPQ